MNQARESIRRRKGLRKKGGDAEKKKEADALSARDLLVKMQRAARSDREQFKKHQPGLEKLKLVNEVIQALRDPDVARALLDQNVLGVLAGAAHEAGWIDVLPNGKLPSLSLRTKLLVEVAQLPVTKQVFILFLSIFLITLHYFHYE